ncbi:tripartite tricarboxylate transporter TctB family protein [Pseudomonas sp. MOB-449]|nr:tripartite tricarboxylate transporter TctB family protein [Pseudomonas sp. MOB-449]
MARPPRVLPAQMAVGISLVVISVVLAYGAHQFPAEMGFTILGAHVYPYAVAIFLGGVGVLLSFQASTGGPPEVAAEEGQSDEVLPGGRAGAVWITAGLLSVALLITHIGFVLSAGLLFTCAARGFGSRNPLRDLAIGVALTLPVYWLFTTGLGVSLPPLVNAWI